MSVAIWAQGNAAPPDLVRLPGHGLMPPPGTWYGRWSPPGTWYASRDMVRLQNHHYQYQHLEQHYEQQYHHYQYEHHDQHNYHYQHQHYDHEQQHHHHYHNVNHYHYHHHHNVNHHHYSLSVTEMAAKNVETPATIPHTFLEEKALYNLMMDNIRRLAPSPEPWKPIVFMAPAPRPLEPPFYWQDGRKIWMI